MPVPPMQIMAQPPSTSNIVFGKKRPARPEPPPAPPEPENEEQGSNNSTENIHNN